MREFDDWYRALHPRLHAALRITCGSVHEADEAVDEAFARASARWPKVSAMENPDGWTYTVALNVMRRRARRRSREREFIRAGAADAPGHQAPDHGASARFTELVSGLPDRMREVVVLRHVGDLTEPAIAEVLSISRGTVSSTLRDAHARIANRLLTERSEGDER